jgi:hypothetical protein
MVALKQPAIVVIGPWRALVPQRWITPLRRVEAPLLAWQGCHTG